MGDFLYFFLGSKEVIIKNLNKFRKLCRYLVVFLNYGFVNYGLTNSIHMFCYYQLCYFLLEPKLSAMFFNNHNLWVSSCEKLYRKAHDSCIFVFLNFLIVCTFQLATHAFWILYWILSLFLMFLCNTMFLWECDLKGEELSFS